MSLVIWTSSSNLICQFYSKLPIFFIGYFFGSQLLGQYELAYGAIYLPIGIVLSSINDIFKAKISREINIEGNCKKTFKSFLEILTKFSIYILLPFLLIFPYIFTFVFGNQWNEGGYLIRVMFLLICSNFVANPLKLFTYNLSKTKN